MRASGFAVLAAATTAGAARFAMYFDEWHKTTLPSKEQTAGVNYVITAYAMSDVFTNGTDYAPFMPLDQIRALFDQGTKVCMSIGGGGDKTGGFSAAIASDEARGNFAKNIASTADKLGFDCVDINWKFPGGLGEEERKGEVEAYPKLLSDVKGALGQKELSIAVPGNQNEMTAFTSEQCPNIAKSVDFANVVSYGLQDPSRNETNHHSSVEDSKSSVDRYTQCGIPADKLNLGIAFFAKFKKTVGTCQGPLGCPIEDAGGKDPEKAGDVTFEAENLNGTTELSKAMENGQADNDRGGQWWWNPDTSKFWTWDTPEFIAKKCGEIVKGKQLGGAFAWSLGEDSKDGSHLKALQDCFKAQ
ncbi:glycosyl hydrolases family 18 domain-containing protein [Hirsutella rhossiliensis]|uniref:chitinase n=1 Tax=Hirsutella rhossiliensis TaxID=111463 RepID=A0A9P8SDX6_9HYPO|nr:glycosyl hydrolases family 18 domain-containing protein [Hirsutella rhossiliensis]KAH0958414.1 glycosyl hydrolases family 18 domain-containing protein [Hirsutella rhossiliensis]